MKEESERIWKWWIVLPVVTLGLIVCQIADAAMTSVFDESEDD